MASIAAKIKKLASIVEARFEDYVTEEGTVLHIDGEPSQDKEVRITDGDGNEVLAPDGDYIISEGAYAGQTLVVREGIITSIVAANTEQVEMADFETFDEMIDGLFGIVSKMSEQYHTIQSQLAVILEAQQSEATEIVMLKEDMARVKKAPAVKTATIRTAQVQASEPKLSRAHQLMVEHYKRQNQK